MLPRHQRLTHPAEFSSAVRGGSRASSRHVVMHTRLIGNADGAATAPRVGFVVSKAVGDAVTRNRVKRRLRHLMAARLDRVPGSSLVVIRALPASAAASSTDLGLGLDRCLSRLYS